MPGVAADTWHIRPDPGIERLSGFNDLAGFEAAGAHLHSAIASGGKLDPDRLKVRIESSPRFIVGMGNIVAELRPLPTNITSLCHKIIASDTVSRRYKRVFLKTQKQDLYQTRFTSSSNALIIVRSNGQSANVEK